MVIWSAQHVQFTTVHTSIHPVHYFQAEQRFVLSVSPERREANDAEGG